VREPHADLDRALVRRRKAAKAERARLRVDRRLTEPFRELDDASRFDVGGLQVSAFCRNFAQSRVRFGVAERSLILARNFGDLLEARNRLIKTAVFKCETPEPLFRNTAIALIPRFELRCRLLISLPRAGPVSPREDHVRQSKPRERLL